MKMMRGKNKILSGLIRLPQSNCVSLEHGKNSNDGENLRIGKPNISMENDQWSNVCNVTNGILYRFINCSICPLSDV